MGATIMEQTTSLIQNLQKSSPEITFVSAQDFGWNPETKTIRYDESSDSLTAYLLHEYGHALLSHDSYDRDIDLIAMERDAWKKAREIAKQYDLTISAELVEDSLDSYRDWMHARSQCPTCSATGIQTEEQRYTCIACRACWKVNEARRCALRRYKTK